MRHYILNEREKNILQAIIHAYTLTAEPIGSKVLLEHFSLGLSPATIRNVMARLEECGLIRQLHTSSGRVPTDEGYRFYVAHLLHENELSVEEQAWIEQLYLEDEVEMPHLMDQTSRTLAVMTDYMSMVSWPHTSSRMIKMVRLFPLDEGRLIVAVVFLSGLVKEKVVRLQDEFSPSELSLLEKGLNWWLKQEEGADIQAFLWHNKDFHFATKAMSYIKQLAQLDIFENKTRISLSGQRQLTAYPEFCNYERLAQVMKMFDDQAELHRLLEESLAKDKDDVNIFIGGHNKGLEDFTVVTANYKIGSEVAGSVGVIGPKRMRYPRVIAIVESVADSLSRCLTREKE